jgi:hypothetical protein
MDDAKQIAVLLAFYSKFDSAKTKADIVAILAKRKKGAAVLPLAQFEDLCEKLAAKYGETPKGVYQASMGVPKLQQLPANTATEAAKKLQASHKVRAEPEPEPEPALSDTEVAERRIALQGEIKKTEITVFSWESIIGTQTSNQQHLKESLVGLRSRLADLQLRLAELDRAYPLRTGDAVQTTKQSAVIKVALPAVWQRIQSLDWSWWCSEVSQVTAVGGAANGTVGGTLQLAGSHDCGWTMRIDQISNLRKSLKYSNLPPTAAGLQPSASVSVAAAPGEYKIKLRPVSSDTSTLVEWSAKLHSPTCGHTAETVANLLLAALGQLRTAVQT